ncbi:MAG: DUF1178 family protein [Pseudomonadota bacterium]
MIRYSLKCSNDHGFESWFKDSASYDKLADAGQVVCPICGTGEIEKAIMAPAVSGTRKKDGPSRDPAPEPNLSAPATQAELALRKLRQHIEKNSDYVGQDFASEARRIHDGESDARAIWGEATMQDAKDLHEDGIPVAPLPWMNRRND